MGINGKNNLSSRMKHYEACYSTMIPPRTYTIVRVDGRGFSKFTKGMNKPFDPDFSEAMNDAAVEMCKKFNPAFAYTQSDEITLVFTDFGENQEAMFKGKVQKICSLTAARATASFNKKLTLLKAHKYDTYEDSGVLVNDLLKGDLLVDVEFDSRVYVIPHIKEVANCIVWRQQDATRNSISMAADALYSHKELMGKSSDEKQEMMFQKGVNWNDYITKYKRGAIIKKIEVELPTSRGDLEGSNTIEPSSTVLRKKWVIDYDTPIFTQDWDYLYDLIPSNCD
jgi:tRNA(His) 5'-end guanylyltransferase